MNKKFKVLIVLLSFFILGSVNAKETSYKTIDVNYAEGQQGVIATRTAIGNLYCNGKKILANEDPIDVTGDGYIGVKGVSTEYRIVALKDIPDDKQFEFVCSYSKSNVTPGIFDRTEGKAEPTYEAEETIKYYCNDGTLTDKNCVKDKTDGSCPDGWKENNGKCETDASTRSEYKCKKEGYELDGKKCISSDRNDVYITVKTYGYAATQEYYASIDQFRITEDAIIGDGKTKFPSSYLKDYVDYDADANAKKYLNIIKTKDSFIARLKKDVTIGNENIDTKITINFNNNGKKYKIIANIRIEGNAPVYAYGNDLCQASSPWEKIQPKDEAMASDIGSLDYKWELRYNGGKVNFPSCSSSELLEFKGWYYHTGRQGSLTLNTAVCADADANGGIHSGTDVDVASIIKQNNGNRGSFVACFNIKKSVRIYTQLPSAILKETGSWKPFTSVNNEAMIGIYYQNLEEGVNITLPEVNAPEFDTNFKYEFDGWSTSPSCPSKVPAGTTVNEESNYYACFTKVPVYHDGDFIDNKRVVEGKTEKFVSRLDTTDEVYIDSEAHIMSNDSIEVSTGEDGITIKGLKASFEPTKLIVKGTYNGQTISVYYMVYVDWSSASGDDGSGYVGEGEIISSETGAEYDLTGFLTATQDLDPTCKKFKIKKKDATLYDTVEVNGKKLKGAVYDATIKCGDESTTFKAVCLDPGREEPSGQLYYRNTEMNVKGDNVDKLTAGVYNLQSGFDVEKPKDLIAAEFALRLIAVMSGDDLNNINNGYGEYYKGFVKISKHIKKDILGKKETAILKPEDYNDKFAKKMEGYKNKKEDFFCGNSTCTVIDSGVLKKAFDYIKAGAEFTISEGFTPTIKVGKTEVTWTDKANGSYKKVIEGTISGLSRSKQNFVLDLKQVCPQCGQNGVDAKLYVGSDANHLVNYYTKYNYLNAKYSDFKESDWYEGQYDPNYNDLFLMTSKGTLYYKYVISANIKVLSSSGKGGSGGGGGGGDKYSGIDYNIYIALGSDTEEYLIDTGTALPATSSNLQRMVIFAKPSKPKEDYDSAGIGSGSRSQISYPTAPSNIEFNYKCKLEDNNCIPRTIRLLYKTIGPGTILPTCDMDVDEYKYGTSSFNPSLFKGAGCCSYVMDEKSPVYQHVCMNKCSYNSFSPICKTGNEGTGSEPATEVLKIHEGMKNESDGSESGQMTCVYANENKYNSHHADMTRKDDADNLFNISSYDDNPVCNVYCKEDWDFMLPDLTNYTGHNAVIAGQYFEVKAKQIRVTGKRSCVTSYIYVKERENIEGNVLYAFQQLSHKLVDAFNSAQLCNGANNALKEYKTKTDQIKFTDIAEKKEVTCKSGEPKGDKCVREVDYTSAECTARGKTYPCGDHDVDGEVATCKHTWTTTVTYSVLQKGYDSWSGVVDRPDAVRTGEGKLEKTDNGSCKDHKLTTTEIDKIKKDAINKTKGGNCAGLGTARAEIKRLAEQLHQCQQYELTSNMSQNNLVAKTISFDSDPHAYLGDAAGVIDTDITLTIQPIMTIFNPELKYAYDDQEYMSKIGSNNKLKLEQEGDLKQAFAFYMREGFDPARYTGTQVMSGEGGQNAGYTDATVVAAYCTLGGSGTGHTGGGGGGKYGGGGGGTTYHWESEPGCSTIRIPYNSHGQYIKRSLQYDANATKEFNWYRDDISEFREYAKTKEEAMKNSSSNNKNINLWSLYGTNNKNNIVFPVSKSAPRNLYKYQFIYNKIGMYNNDTTTGRIMGNATKSIIPNNKRLCFYEIVEGICYCCGDVISYQIVSRENQDVVSGGSFVDKESDHIATQYYDSTKPAPGVIGFDTTEVDKCAKDNCAKKTNENAVSGVIVSNISLGSIKSNLGRNEGVNWTENTHYTIDGDLYVSDKGANLINKIEELGETIYERTPEYTYTLSPGDMSGIRNINAREGLQVKTETLVRVGGRFRQVSQSGDWEAKNDEIGISHFKSAFLENFMKDKITPGYKEIVITNTDTICYVTADEYKNSGLSKVNGASSFYDGKKYHCRWVDYVGEIKAANEKSKANAKGQYRLSFK